MDRNGLRPARRAVLAGMLLAPAAALARTAGAPALSPAYQVRGRPPLRWTLAERMARCHAPGVSIALIEDRRIAWAEGFGVRAAGRPEPVEPETLFQAASISKVIAATATLTLVQEGRLDLDAGVNRYLKSWRLPDSPLAARERVTLRRILSHRAGLNVHGFAGYRPDEPMPGLLDVLDGRLPARNKPIRVEVTPGTETRYSGGGVVIEQLLLSDVTGLPFPELARERVLAPLAMADSTFAQPLPPAWRARTALGHDSDGVVLDGGWRIGPEMAAGWLWTTPADLARWAIAIDAARRGRPGGVLSPTMAKAMLTRQEGGDYGLGPLLEDEGRAFRFGHGGANTGYRSQLIYFPATGQGAVVMVNGDGGDLMTDEILRGLAVDHDWPALKPKPVQAATLDISALDRLVGAYDLVFAGDAQPTPARIVRDGMRLRLTAAPILDRDEVVPLSDRECLSIAVGYRLAFDLPAAGPARGFVLTYHDLPMQAVRTS